VSQFPKFSIRDDDTDTVLLSAAGISGFFTGDGRAYSDASSAADVEPESVTFGLSRLGSSDLGSHESPKPLALGNIWIDINNFDGGCIGSYFVSAASVWTPDAGERHHVDLQINGKMDYAPHKLAESVWDTWRASPPSEKNEWVRLPEGSREAWLEVVGRYHAAREPSRRHNYANSTVTLQGANIVDPASLMCALGEAFKGAGGYFGWTLSAFEDCLKSEVPADSNLVLIWESSDTAQRTLAGKTPLGEKSKPYLDQFLEILSSAGVCVLFN
jgi:hypothetical protein